MRWSFASTAEARPPQVLAVLLLHAPLAITSIALPRRFRRASAAAPSNSELLRSNRPQRAAAPRGTVTAHWPRDAAGAPLLVDDTPPTRTQDDCMSAMPRQRAELGC